MLKVEFVQYFRSYTARIEWNIDELKIIENKDEK